MMLVLYLENTDKSLSGQLVLDNGKEFAEGLQKGWRPNALAQQVLDSGQDVEFCLLSTRTTTKKNSKKKKKLPPRNKKTLQSEYYKCEYTNNQ